MLALGACYYPEQWPATRWPLDARLMREAGLDHVRLGEFAWGLLEPAEGRFEPGWLDEAIGILAEAGLAIVLGTPTAAPPPWLMRAHPGLAFVEPDGRPRRAGARRHHCPTSPAFAAHAARITGYVASRWGKHPAVVGWQLDNELGCHGSARCSCDGCVRRFEAWLMAKYGDLDALDAAWGTAVWGQRAQAWADVGPPLGLGYTPNPAHWLDWCRFAAEGHAAFVAAQAAIVRKHSPGRWVTTNLVGGADALDHVQLVAGLDLVGTGNYAPPGQPWPARARGLDRARGLLDRPFWVLEQPAGAIDWAEAAPALRPGEARLAAFQAIAHGADGLLWFQWRQATAGAEQLHGAILPHDGLPGRMLAELAALATELRGLPPLGHRHAAVALLSDEPSRWALAAQPGRRDLAPDDWERSWYDALVARGLDVDVRPPDAELAGYPLVVAGTRYLADEALAARLEAYVAGGGQLVLGPRSGFLDGAGRVPMSGAPGRLRRLAGVRVAEADAPGPERENAVRFAEGDGFPVDGWLEWLEPDPGTEVLATYAADFQRGAPAVTRRGGCWYVGARGADDGLASRVLAAAGAGGARLPADVEVRARGPFVFVLNHAEEPVALPWGRGGRDVLTGQAVGKTLSLPGFGVAVVQG